MPDREWRAWSQPIITASTLANNDRLIIFRGSEVSELTEEEQRRILESPPKGTWVIILIIGLALLAAWLYFFFGVFFSHGPVN